MPPRTANIKFVTGILVRETDAQLQASWTLWESDGTPVAFQYHVIRISSVFRYLFHRILVRIWYYILAPGLAAAQLRVELCCSPVLAPDVFELLCLVIRCAQHVAGWNWAPTLISGPSPAKLQSLGRGEAGRQRAKGWGLGQHICRLARKASSGQRAGVRWRPLRGTADRLLAADSPNSHPWQWRNYGSRQVVTQGLSRMGGARRPPSGGAGNGQGWRRCGRHPGLPIGR